MKNAAKWVRIGWIWRDFLLRLELNKGDGEWERFGLGNWAWLRAIRNGGVCGGCVVIEAEKPWNSIYLLLVGGFSWFYALIVG